MTIASAKSNLVRPTLTVDVHLKDGVVIDASLTPTSRRFLEKIATEIAQNRRQSSVDTVISETDMPATSQELLDNDAFERQKRSPGVYETIEVPLVFDSQFFEMLQSDVENIDALQADEQKSMSEEIIELRREISGVSKPTRFSKTDLSQWRHIFELYLDAEVFFATTERNHGARSSQAALKQLQWFQGEIDKRRLAQGFKLRESQMAFARFLNLNAILLKNLQFQELNRLAVVKILKSKFLIAGRSRP